MFRMKRATEPERIIMRKRTLLMGVLFSAPSLAVATSVSALTKSNTSRGFAEKITYINT